MQFHDSRIEPLNFWAFQIVAGSGGFSAAARRHGQSQSALSSRVAELEAALGRRLFHRHGRGVTLTEEGQYVLDEVVPQISMLQDLLANRALDEPRAKATIKIALADTISSSWGVDLLSKLAKLFPGSSVSVVRAGHLQYEERASIDVWLSASSSVAPWFTSRAFFRSDLFLFGDLERFGVDPHDTSLAALAGKSIPFALSPRPGPIRAMLDNSLQAVRAPSSIETNVFELLSAFLTAGEGLTLAPMSRRMRDLVDASGMACMNCTELVGPLNFYIGFNKTSITAALMPAIGDMFAQLSADAVRSGHLVGEMLWSKDAFDQSGTPQS